MSTPGPITPSDGDDVPTASELQRAIRSVTGVTSAEVTRGDNGRDRLRISLAPGEDPEAVAWSVAATLRERFGIALDPAAITARVVGYDLGLEQDPVRVVSSDAPSPGGGEPLSAAAPAPGPQPVIDLVTSAGPTPGSAPSPPGRQASYELVAAAREAVGDGGPPVTGATGPSHLRHRAAIRELTARPDGDDLDVAATLGLSGRLVTGRARGLRTRRGRWRAIAEATISALDELTVGRVRGNIDHVTVLTYADLAHVSVSVTLLTDRGEETFLGAALVRDDPDRAVMRAVLDAVNRRVEPWLADAAAAAGG